MQTFVPLPDFVQSAHVLDRQRLGKQRVETLQIASTIVVGGRWRNHPVMRMWDKHLRALAEYQRIVCANWVARGFKDTCLAKTLEVIELSMTEPLVMPPWFGDEAFHRSHQSNLIRKQPLHYRPLFPGVPDNLPYVWPWSTEP